MEIETVSGNLKKKTDDQLAAWQSQFRPGSDTFILAENEWRRREKLEQHRYNKEQIELQHERNMELVKKQVRWIKFSAIITAIATLSAVVLGWYLSELKSLKFPKSDSQQIVQPQTKTSTLASRSEKINGKVPLEHPLNGKNKQNR
jgi:hypothetical protein